MRHNDSRRRAKGRRYLGLDVLARSRITHARAINQEVQHTSDLPALSA